MAHFPLLCEITEWFKSHRSKWWWLGDGKHDSQFYPHYQYLMFHHVSIHFCHWNGFPTVPPKILRQVTGKLHLFAELARPISRISGVGPREGQSRHSWSSHSVAAQGVMGEQWLNQTSGCRYNIYLRVYDISIFITYNYIYAIQRVYIYVCVCISLATYI